MTPEKIIPGTFEDDHTAVTDAAAAPPCVQILIEDFGGSFAIPHYGCSRPSADYFNSNLMVHNFVVADPCNGVNRVIFYDERAQGKNADALCSLRFMVHRALLIDRLVPKAEQPSALVPCS